MKQYTIMLKPASSLCNLRCRYCFYADVSQMRELSSYGMMSIDTADRLIDQVFRSVGRGDNVCFAFQGGEPTLAGLEFFHHFVQRTETCRGGTSVNYAFQTNGTLLDEDWCRFLKEWQFLVGVSMDISPAFHNHVRLDPDGKGTFKLVRHKWNLLQEFGVDCNILAVLTSEMARHPHQVWNAMLDMKAPFVQFIPCLEELDSCKDSPFALTPRRFAQFYNGLFPLWLNAFQQGRYISVKFFDDVFNLLSRGEINSCGLTGQCHAQLVVEADGGVYPCDFYVLDKYRMGNLSDQSISELLDSPAVQSFYQDKEPLPTLCQDCTFLTLCNGGCKRMRRSVYLQDGFCGYQDFLQRNGLAIQKLARSLT